MAKSRERLQAQKLRRGGMSIKAIAKEVGVSKGSVSLWCRDIALTKKQREKLRRSQIAAGHLGRMAGAETNRRRRVENINNAEKWAEEAIGKLSQRDIFMLGIGLYWGEGVKSQNGPAAIVNSDPAVIVFAKYWFEECLGVLPSQFRPYIFISEHHRSREKDILRFWSKLLKLPPSQFNNIVFLKGRPKKIYSNHNSYYGVLALRVRRGTDLKYRILGLIKSSKNMPA